MVKANRPSLLKWLSASRAERPWATVFRPFLESLAGDMKTLLAGWGPVTLHRVLLWLLCRVSGYERETTREGNPVAQEIEKDTMETWGS